MRCALPLLLLAFAPSLSAQDAREPRFRIGLGLAGGSFDFETEAPNPNGDADAAMLRLSFEATSARGIGGGVRLESLGTDDDLFADAGFPDTQAGLGNLFAHFTYRLESHRFAMPMRAGLMLNGLTIEDDAAGTEDEFASFGPYVEVAPEIVLARSGRTQFSLFGEVGFGFGATAIELDGDSRDYESVTGFAGLELGARLLMGPIELGLSYVGRWQSTDESDPEGGLVVPEYDIDFNGLLFSFAVVF
jgi:hypothetical protein